MKLLVITSPDKIDNEIEKIIALFEAGLACLHLRKPNWNDEEYLEFFKKIPFKYYKKIVIHACFKICEIFNVFGIHINGQTRLTLGDEKVKNLIKVCRNRNLLVSTSFHSTDEIRLNKFQFDYMFIGPFYNSVSKPDYKAKLALNQLDVLSDNLKNKLVVLGGINSSNIGVVSKLNVYGVAVIGAIWENGDVTVAYQALRKEINEN